MSLLNVVAQVSDIHQLDTEEEVRIWVNITARTCLTIGQIPWNHDEPTVADVHVLEAILPTLDDVAASEAVVRFDLTRLQRIGFQFSHGDNHKTRPRYGGQENVTQ